MQIPTLTWSETLARLGLALVLGAIVGVERERGERSAGMRTFALVCFGSALITLVSAYGFTDFLKYPSVVRMDPSRIAAQIVSGIGFLGAGTIIFRQEIVRGLTTAAGLWVVAGIGMATGAGLYFVAVASTAGSVLILAILKPIERRFFPRRQRLVLRARATDGQLDAVRGAFNASGVRLYSLRLRAETGGEDVLHIDSTPVSPERFDRLIDLLRAVPGIVAIEASHGAAFGEQDDEEDRQG